ncbi:MAG TPA: sulfite exporter TauE/SafE family protein [Thermomicrobiales bacterium]|nr:sulfite exporter TauE/SafE family protein [Thermomicrobiales bacterium]
MELWESVALGGSAALAAVLGSMLGLGGGVFLVPIFTLFFGIDPKIAIAASAICVITNSVVGSSNHLRNGFTNIRLAMLLGLTTISGAIAGALLAVVADASALSFIFGIVLLAAAISMLVRRQAVVPNSEPGDPDPFLLEASFTDRATGGLVRYIPQRVRAGLTASAFAGVLSGLLGVGGGVVQVPMMNLLMRVPVKGAAGTSTLLVGMTAVATATVFYADGKVDASVVVPAMIGIFVGSQLGSTLTSRVKTANLVLIFVAIMLYLSVSMILKSFGIELPAQD